jgi:DNA (cytosine-5)-methyltransferase 1
MNHIELFAGCGGLSLGLESEGFELLLANELSPMASETFAFNHLGLDLKNNGIRPDDKIHWISSQYSREQASERLKEDPNFASGLKGKISDLTNIDNPIDQLRRSLLIGSILDLNEILADKNLTSALRKGLGAGSVDLVSGGPPCQSFSMAGLRQHSNSRNSLPWAFAEFVSKIRPKIALLENVTGILRAFNIDGQKYYAWYEVAKAFAMEGYIPICLHVNAKYVGAAQNRPRFVMIALRKDIANKARKSNGELAFEDALSQSFDFCKLVKKEEGDLEYGHLKFHDVENGSALYKNPIFSSLVTHRDSSEKARNNQKPNSRLVTVKNAIDDLHGEKRSKSKYIKYINEEAFNKHAYNSSKLENHELRSNNTRVKARFRLYQLMNRISAKSRREIRDFLRTGDKALVQTSSLKELSAKGWLMTVDGQMVENLSKERLLGLLEPLRTKKQTQKALVEDKPAPAALSIPDDTCHYHDGTLRTLTVREMARIQSFPDWFEFRSKVTTGGKMRKFQVPQYTQVGNAVPPLLGKALGKVCKEILEISEK